MKLLLKSATIVDAQSKHHLKKRDVLIDKGVIQKISTSIKDDKARTIPLKDLHISKGWFDSSVSFGEPGFEERETLENGLKVAAKSGFTGVAVNANTNPVIDSKAAVKFLQSKDSESLVSIYPIGALTTGSKGIDLAEVYDMQNEGAVSFYDYQKPIENANLLKIALQYVQNFEGLVQSFPMDVSVAKNGVVHEGLQSTQLGLKGIPVLAEELQIARDLYLLEYTGGKLHIPTISSEKGLTLIKAAKKKGLEVSCSVAIQNLALNDSVLDSFDTNFKLLPPLRTEADRKALLKGLKEGVIDGVTSNHNPIDIENKRTEFDHAMYGSIGLESCFGSLLHLTDVETAVEALTALKSTFGIETHSLEEGSMANLTLFTPKGESVFNANNIMSTATNAALVDQKMQGAVYGVINNSQIFLNE